MAKKTKKKSSPKKAAKKAARKPGRNIPAGESMYLPELAERAREMILEFKPLTDKGKLHFGKVTKLLGLNARTLSRWKNPENEYYKQDFARALIAAEKELVELIDSDQIKQGQIARAKPYMRVKKTKELQKVGPELPALSGLDKESLIKVGAKLKLKLNKNMSAGAMKLDITNAAFDQTKMKMVLVKQEEEQMHGDTAAAKFVLPNIGPVPDRWDDKQKLDVHVDGLDKLLEEIDGKGSRLPEDI